MVRNLLIIVLSATSVFAQAVFAQTKPPASKSPSATPGKSPAASKSPSPAPSAAPDKKTPDAPPEETVITIHGLCDKKDAAKNGANKDSCVSTVGREEFEEVVQTVSKPDQPMASAQKKALAEKYVELLAFANAGKDAGVDQSDDFAAALYLLQLRTLAEFYQRQLELEFRNPPQTEIDAYYKEHSGDFVSLNLSRIYVPRNDPSAKVATPEQKTAFSTKSQQVADDLNARAAKGENLEKLQKECYEKLGINGTPPNPSIGPVRKGSLPAADDKQIFALDTGGVFKSEATGAYTIYKVDSKQTLPETTVKDEIGRIIFRQKMEKRIKEINAAVKADYDDKYFGSTATPGTPPSAPK